MYKVKCTLGSFAGDEKNFPCHFNYKIGDEFYFDGERFTGRICPGLLPAMTPVVYGVFLLGNKYFENVMYHYRGIDARDPGMKIYDGLGFRPLKTPPDNAPDNLVKAISATPRTTKSTSGHFVCGDSRTLAVFTCEAIDLSDSDYCQPFYRRAISILQKIETEPGIRTSEILDRFTVFEREQISPPLSLVLSGVLLEALSDMGYVHIKDDKATTTGKEPPSRPQIG
jgi:uncharacterized repeat protein (TIGR04076 family)